MHISLFNARGINPVENWLVLEYDQLQKLGHEVRLFDLRENQPTKEDRDWMDFACFHFSQVALHYKRLGVPYCILPSTHDCLRDDGETLRLATQNKNYRFTTYQSQFHKKKYKEWTVPEPYAYVPMPCRIDLFKRKSWSMKRIIAGGRLIPKKGLDRIIGKVANLTIFGDGPLRRELEYMDANTEFTGWLDGKRLKELMEESWLFLCPSIITPDGDHEGIPNTLKEALAMRMQVLASDVGGIRELKHIHLLDDWSSRGIRDAMNEISRQENIEGERFIRENYSPKVCVDLLLNAIEIYG